MFKCAMCNQRKKISWNLLMIPRNVSENLLNFNVKHNEWMAQRNAVQHSVEYENAARCSMCVYVYLREVKAHARFIHLHMVHIDLCAPKNRQYMPLQVHPISDVYCQLFRW